MDCTRPTSLCTHSPERAKPRTLIQKHLFPTIINHLFGINVVVLMILVQRSQRRSLLYHLSVMGNPNKKWVRTSTSLKSISECRFPFLIDPCEVYVPRWNYQCRKDISSQPRNDNTSRTSRYNSPFLLSSYQ